MYFIINNFYKYIKKHFILVMDSTNNVSTFVTNSTKNVPVNQYKWFAYYSLIGTKNCTGGTFLYLLDQDEEFIEFLNYYYDNDGIKYYTELLFRKPEYDF